MSEALVTAGTAPGGARTGGRVTRRLVAGRLRYLLRRLGFYLFTGWAAITMNFVLPRFMPGDPGDALLRGMQRQTGQVPTPEQIAAVRTFYGDPTHNLLAQYGRYWWDLAHLRLGTSLSQYPTPVSHLVGDALPWTMVLVGATTLLAWVLGTLLGAYMGWKPGNRFDSVFAPVTTFVHAIPPFWLSLLALYVFGFVLGWFPLSGGYDPSVPFRLNNVWFLLSVLKYGALPAMTLIFIGFNGWLFSMRNVMVTTVSEDYVQLARAKGLSPTRVLLKYAARNALLPNVTGLALAIGGVIGGVLLTEIVFTYPGMGYLLFQALQQHDFPVMQAIFLLITLTALAANFIADSLYALLDPRTKERG
ncbi:ABC transporter permease [Actinocatenispora rupis]|uniref:Peptide ABC transporter permease n=1 Tax=Actinocatenispora rupis TaxID=519421 RepID=A0A8J3IUY2_9ACTN|nr:ABC transporter permease [Actinocatenispora rupis]GID10391.1 peptide ABC transporter permease [Actinocatenispora rupis]